MRLHSFLVGLGLALAAAQLPLLANESILVLPGASTTDLQIPVFTGNPFQPRTSLTATAPGGFLALTSPDGRKVYVVSRPGGGGLTVYDAEFVQGRVISGSIAAATVGGGISPDGRRILLLTTGGGSQVTGNVFVFDTATDALAPNGVVPPATGTTGELLDVAFSVDSNTAFVLSSNGNNSTISAIDLTSNTITRTLTVAGAGVGIGTSPGGLLYVTALNRIYEINPRTLQITTGGEIQVNASVGKPSFTPDGRYLLAVNRTPVTGSAIVMIDLSDRTQQQFFGIAGVRLDRLVLAGNTRGFAYSNDARTLYDLNLQTRLVSQSSLQGVLPSVIGSFDVSNEVPSRYLFVTGVASSGNTLYKIDLQDLSIVGQFPVPSNPEQIVVYSNPNPTSGATSMVIFNGTQTVAAGSMSAPLVVRVQDALGRPVSGARVDFATVTPGVTVLPSFAFTSGAGYAQSFATVASTTAPGPVQVTATSTGIPQTSFTLNVPGQGTGGGPSGSVTIKVLSGDGQLIPGGFPAGEPLAVIVTDADGKPVTGTPVTFTVTTGSITLVLEAANSFTTTVQTDSRGIARIAFNPSPVPLGLSFERAVVTASSQFGTVDFRITSVVTLNGAVAAIAQIFEPEATPFRSISGPSGTIIPGAVRVGVVVTAGPDTGRPIPDVLLKLTPPAGDDPTKVPTAVCANQAYTDGRGIAVCDAQLGSVVGQYELRANVGNFTEFPLVVNVTVGGPSRIVKLNGDNQTGPGGQALPQALRIRVTDAGGNTLAGVPLSWQVTQGAATLTGTNTVTDINGTAQTSVTLGQTPGNVTVRVTAGTGASAPTATFTLSVATVVGGVAIASGDAQTAFVNQAFGQPLVVAVTDDRGQALANTTVTWAVTSGSAVVSSGTSVTDAAGRASINATAGAGAGPIVISATAGNRAVSFTLTARVPGPPVNSASFVNGANGLPGLPICGVSLIQAPGLAPSIVGVVRANNFVGPLGTSLAGLDLTVNGVAAPIFWVSADALAFQTPCSLQPGLATIVVRSAGGATTTVQGVQLFEVQPGIFESIIDGRKYAVVLRDDGTPVTPANPALRGRRHFMLVTGLGRVTPATTTGAAGTGGQNVVAPIVVGVNNGGVRFISAQLLPGQVGVYLVEFEVPADTQTGPYQNVAVGATGPDGNTVLAGSFMPIQ